MSKKENAAKWIMTLLVKICILILDIKMYFKIDEI